MHAFMDPMKNVTTMGMRVLILPECALHTLVINYICTYHPRMTIARLIKEKERIEKLIM